MKRSAALFFAILILFCLLTSCAEQESPPTCREILSAVTEVEVGLPSGKFYSMTAEEGDDEFLSKSMISSIFGGGSFPTIAEDWLDCALFLSFGNHPCELAIILCQNHDAALDTSRLLSDRLSAIKITKNAPEYAEMIDSAKVVVKGNYALLLISSDSENALEAFVKNK